MPVRHALLFIIFFLFFFAPGLEHWMRTGASEWYRPYIVWFLVIVIAFLGQKLGKPPNA
jgi:hypothetical protein